MAQPIVVIRRARERKQVAYRLLGKIGADATLRGKSRAMVKLNIAANLPPHSSVITSHV